MAKTSVLHTRMDSELKDRAEFIFAQLGLTSADAIKLFYKQVDLQGGLPFDLKVPPKTLAERTFFEEIEKGEKSAEEKGWIGLSDSKSMLGL